MNEIIKVTYFTGVKKPCGYRQEMVTAIARVIRPKMCEIISAKMDDTDTSKRQQFNGKYWAEQEIRKHKKIATLRSIENADGELL